MGARAFALALLALACGAAGSAHAQPAISVHREAGAESCPDTEELTARLIAILGQGAEQSGAYRVTFSRRGQTFFAAIHAEADGTTARYLHAREASCAALGHATALARAPQPRR